MKTLNLLNLSELRCDCRMRLEHIARVQDPIYWDPRILNNIMIGDICIPNPSKLLLLQYKSDTDSLIFIGVCWQYIGPDFQCTFIAIMQGVME